MIKFARTGSEANAIAIRTRSSIKNRKILLFVDIMVGTIGICHQLLIKKII